MSLVRMVIRELAHRWANGLLSLCAVAAAVACVLVLAGMLRGFDRRTEVIIAEKSAEVEKRTADLQEEYRKIGTKMGFNVLILPKDQNLADLYANDFADRFMPESYVDTLSRASIVTIAHVLPVLQQKVEWREAKRTILLVGTRGEVPLAGEVAKKPLLDLVPAGQIVLGWELHRGLGITEGASVRLLGRAFKVKTCYPERGSKDDITAWINLAQAQEMLGKKGQISGILALECNCAMAAVGKIREEIGRILPGTQVIEFASQALARAEARRKAADYATQALADEQAGRDRLRAEKEGSFVLMTLIAIAAAALWVGLLALVNVNERRAEVGVLRALGWAGSRVLLLFVLRAALIGLVGSLLGCGAALALLAGRPDGAQVVTMLANPAVLAAAIVGAPLLSAAACWIPSLVALQQDPAVVLRG